MKGKVIDRGHYKLMKSVRDRLILIFNGTNTFVWTKEKGTDRLWFTEGISEKSGDADFDEINSGSYFIINKEEDEEFSGLPHLYLKHKNHYDEFILREGFPDYQEEVKDLVVTNRTVPEEEIETYAYDEKY